MRRLILRWLVGNRLTALERTIENLNRFAEETCDAVNPLIERVDKLEAARKAKPRKRART